MAFLLFHCPYAYTLFVDFDLTSTWVWVSSDDQIGLLQSNLIIAQSTYWVRLFVLHLYLLLFWLQNLVFFFFLNKG